MAFGNRFRFRFESVHGVEYNIYILKDGYSGTCHQRALGRAPVLKKQQNGPICGTSLELYAQCEVDGEFAELYTSDPKQFRVDVYRKVSGSDVLIWRGFVSTELYSEPSIYPPYDVQIVATDGLGELKLNDFSPSGEQTLLAHFWALLNNAGEYRDIYMASSLIRTGGSKADTMQWTINLDFLDGKNCYEVLTSLLDSLHATITSYKGAWLIARETDIATLVTGSSLYALRCYLSQGSTIPSLVLTTISGAKKSIGAMGVADMWPEGYFSTSIAPARNSISVKALWHPVAFLQDSEMRQGTRYWSFYGDGNYRYVSAVGSDVSGFFLGNDGNSNTPLGGIRQSIPVRNLKSGFKLTVTAIGAYSTGGIVLAKKAGVLNFNLYFVPDDVSGDSMYGSNAGWFKPTPLIGYFSKPDGGEMENTIVFTTSATDSEICEDLENNSNFEEFSAIVPANESLGAGTLYFEILGRNIFVLSANLEAVATEDGFQDTIRLNNGARGAGDEVEIIGPRIPAGGLVNVNFFQGIWKSGGLELTSFADSNFSNADFLSIQTLGRAMSVAYARQRTEGKLDVPASLPYIPLLIQAASLVSWVNTFEWDLREDSLTITALSLPNANIIVDSETVEPIEGGGGSGSSSGGGGSSSGGSSGGGGADLLSFWRSLTNNEALGGYDDDTKIAPSHYQVTSAMVIDALGYTPARENGESLRAPVLQIFRGYDIDSSQSQFAPFLEVTHPLLEVSGLNAQCVLMVWSKRRGRLIEHTTGGNANSKYRTGWGEVRGEHATTAPFTFARRTTLDSIRQFILNKCMCGQGLTAAQMETITLSEFRNMVSSSAFGFKGKHGQTTGFHAKSSRLFGIAIRYENPQWTAAVSGTVAETTREVYIGQNTYIKRYIYTEVTPFRVHCNTTNGVNPKYVLGFQMQPINSPKP